MHPRNSKEGCAVCFMDGGVYEVQGSTRFPPSLGASFQRYAWFQGEALVSLCAQPSHLGVTSPQFSSLLRACCKRRGRHGQRHVKHGKLVQYRKTAGIVYCVLKQAIISRCSILHLLNAGAKDILRGVRYSSFHVQSLTMPSFKKHDFWSPVHQSNNDHHIMFGPVPIVQG